MQLLSFLQEEEEEEEEELKTAAAAAAAVLLLLLLHGLERELAERHLSIINQRHNHRGHLQQTSPMHLRPYKNHAQGMIA
jgi:hypothetical protein